MTNAMAFDENSNDSNVRIPQREGATLRTPDAANQLVCKILGNPRREKEAYYEVQLHKHMVGPDPQKHSRYHLSRKMLGERSPEADKFWELMDQLKALKESGKENSDEYRKIENQKKVFSTSFRYLLLVLPLGATEPKVLEVTFDALKKLFGAPAKGKDPAYTGLIETMKSKGRDPHSLKSETGWVKLWRTGKGLDTEWHVHEATVEVKVDGEDVTKPLKQAVNPAVFKLTLDKIPDVTKVHQTPDRLWTDEECQAFVASYGTQIPERCYPKNNSNGGAPKASENRKAPAVDSDVPWGGAANPEVVGANDETEGNNLDNVW